MSMDLDMGIPFLPEDGGPEGDSIRQEEKRNRRLFLLGGAMNAMGGYMGPVYPLLLDPMEDDKEEDPNP